MQEIEANKPKTKWSLRGWGDRILENSERVAEHRSAPAVVTLIELAGTTIAPLPIALILMAMVTAAPRKWLRFTLGATAGSFLSGLSLYVIGWAFFHSLGQWLVSYYGSVERWAGVVEWFNSGWGIAFVAFACLSTGLFRVAGLGAGFTGMNFPVFILALVLCRGARWFITCAVVSRIGDRIRAIPSTYFKYATLAAVLVVVATLLMARLII